MKLQQQQRQRYLKILINNIAVGDSRWQPMFILPAISIFLVGGFGVLLYDILMQSVQGVLAHGNSLVCHNMF